LLRLSKARSRKRLSLSRETAVRFIIYGAGAIGGVVGGLLAMSGQDVVLIGRLGQVEAINRDGLRLIMPTGTQVLRLVAVTAPDQVGFEPKDVVFLCMKGQNTAESVHDLRSVVEDVPVFSLQNGVRNEEIAAGYFPRVYGATIRIPSVYLADGEVIARNDPPGWLLIGWYPSGVDELVESVVTKLHAAGFLARSTSDIMPHKWGKLIMNLGNAIGAVCNAKEKDVEPIARAVQREAREILDIAGIRGVEEEELAKDWPEIAVPPRSRLATEAQSSTWQSLARRQGTVETDLLNGEIVRLAEKHGRQAPINEMLLRICERMAASRELPGKYTPAQLAALLGLDYSPYAADEPTGQQG